MAKNRAVMITGVNTLSDKLKKNIEMDAVKKIVKDNTLELERKMKRNANFKGHYKDGKQVEPTGATRRSIESKISRNGITGIVGPKTHYSYYLEFGTRFMRSQPFVGPSYRQQKAIFLSDMKKLVN